MSALAFLIVSPAVALTFPLILFCAGRWILVPADRKRCEWLLVASTLSVPAAAACDALTRWMSHLTPYKLDLYLFRVDGLFGQPSFLMGQFVARHFWLEVIANVAYGALPVAMLAVFAAYLWLRPEQETLAVLRTFVLNLFLAVPVYVLFPACGPAFAYASFPHLPPAFVAHRIALGGPANCIPSVHTSTALLILWFVWRWKAARLLGAAYLCLIVVATLGSGQHYLFDLLCAVPYALAVRRLSILHDDDSLRVTSDRTAVAEDSAQSARGDDVLGVETAHRAASVVDRIDEHSTVGATGRRRPYTIRAEIKR
jgi:hypothetical protein